ncbi:MAG: hypothetical protein ABIH19_04635, partial [Candidatus Omnitrophota bacterium]
RLFLSVLCPTPGTVYYDNTPKVEDWYLDKVENQMSRAHFTNVLDMHTFHLIEKNFFDFSDEVKSSLVDYYLTFKKIGYGSYFTKKSPLLSLCMKFDFLVAKLSQAAFNLSPELEFVIFNRVKSIRYFLGNYFFSRNIRNA